MFLIMPYGSGAPLTTLASCPAITILTNTPSSTRFHGKRLLNTNCDEYLKCKQTAHEYLNDT